MSPLRAARIPLSSGPSGVITFVLDVFGAQNSILISGSMRLNPLRAPWVPTDRTHFREAAQKDFTASPLKIG